MSRFILAIEASAVFSLTAPTLEVLVDGFVVSSALITAQTGVGSNLLSFNLDFTGSVPSSLSLRFNDGSAEAGRSMTLEEVRIGGQVVDTTYLSMLILSQNDSSDVDIAPIDHFFGRDEPMDADLGTVTLNGTGAADDLRGINSNDVIDGASGNDRIFGGGGDDAAIGGDGDDFIFGGNGNDILTGGNNDDLILGGSGDDLIFGNDGDDSLVGDAGDDVLNGGIGNDALLGDAGDDVLYGEDGTDALIGGSGNDWLYGDDGDDILDGEAGNDNLYGGAGADYISGGAGADTIYGENDDDSIDGGSGDDTIDGGNGSDIISGADGNDTISGGGGVDYLAGDDGNDILNGDAASDALTGGSGADTLNGGDGNDALYGHSMTLADISQVIHTNAGISYSLATHSFYMFVDNPLNYGAAKAAAEGTLLNGVAGNLVNISSASENSYIQTLLGGNDIWLGATDSAIEGDWRWQDGGGMGVRFSTGGTAEPGMYTNWLAGQPNGGAAEDYAIMNSTGTWSDTTGGTTHRYVVEWSGAAFDDDNAADTLNGGNGNDLLYGYGGNDILNGDDGDDLMFGGDGNDTLNGGNNDDVIYDDVGNNIFDGGAGNDILDARYLPAQPSTQDQIDAILTANPGVLYSADTGNFYRFFNGNFQYATASANAAAASLGGVAGHLLTITSPEENDFVTNSVISDNVWIAASDSATEGEWLWLEGPEAGQKFWTGGGSGSAFGGMYENWRASEPDNTTTDNYGRLRTNGSWDDRDGQGGGQDTESYVVEWEGSSLIVTMPAAPAQGDNIMNGGAGSDTIYGGNGDDTIDGGSGNDTMNGGSGTDTLSYAAATAGVTVNLSNTGAQNTVGAGTDSALNFENLTGSDYNDTLTGDGNDNVITGGAGADTINGGGGNDTFQLANGDFAAGETITGGGGTDEIALTNATTVDFTAGTLSGITTLTGSGGADTVTISVSSLTSLASLNLASGADILNTVVSGNITGGTLATLNSITTGNVIGTGGNDSFTATGAQLNTLLISAARIDMGAGTDTLNITSTSADLNTAGSTDASIQNLETISAAGAGGGVTISLSGQSEGFIVNGSNHDDILTGGSGNDTIDGNNGNDTLNGGGGADTIYSGSGTNTLNGDAGDDILHSESSGTSVTVASILTANPTLVYSSDTGNFYEIVSATLDWDMARAAAAASTINGVAGHLATITSQEEHDFIVALAIGQNTWLGGSDDPSITGGGGFDDWYWVDGPEAGTHFSTGGTAEPGQFTNWNVGQPNDTDDTQNYLYLLNSNNGWADLAIEGDGSTGYVTVPRYLVEWEGSDLLIPAGGNTLNGGDGNDTLYGDAGADILYGGNDDDTLYSGSTNIPTTVSIYSATFDSNVEGFSYSDGFGSGGPGGSDPANADVSGQWTNSDGHFGLGALEVYIDGQNTAASSNISGNWHDNTISVANDVTNVQLTLSYHHWHSTQNDNGEDSRVYVVVDGTRYDQNGGNSYISQALGSGGETDTGWVRITINLPDLNAGNHTLALGIFQTAENRSDEDSSVLFDDILLTGDEMTQSTNTLNGGGGNDSLYGNDGIDVFVFENATAFGNLDIIYDFDLAGGDKIDLSDILSNAGYDPVTDAITDFVQFSNIATHTGFYIDVTGSGNFGAAPLIGGTWNVQGLTDEAALEAAGTLITA